MTEPERERSESGELASEQRHLDAAYARLDAMRHSAQRVADVHPVQLGGSRQAREEREAAAANTRRRLAALDIGETPLCFGRLDLAPGDDEDRTPGDGPFYIGRISVTEDDLTPLVVDWRAPVAEPFYRATAVEPMGVARRRHFQTSGRTIVGIDDEVFDSDTATTSGLTVVGEGALLAALEQERTGRMRDIVATIQAEQDEAIRAPLSGILVVAGGPGTGKTAVALHRAAYLLYSHRRRLAAQGVLLVGPSSIFLRYIDEVLPSLGEDEVMLATPRSLKSSIKVRSTAPPAVAAVKGDRRMARVIAAAVTDRERPMPRDVMVTLDRHRLLLGRRDSARIVERTRARSRHPQRAAPVPRGPRRRPLPARVPPRVVTAYRGGGPGVDVEDVTVASLLAVGEPAPDDWEQDLTDRLRRLPEVRAALERMWPVLNGAELLNDMFGFEALVRSAAGDVLTPSEQRLLLRDRVPEARDADWTEADLALIDEADAILGPPSAARPRRARRARRDEALEIARRTVEELNVGGSVSAQQILERYGSDSEAIPDDDGEPRRFGHVLVDEAQDLTPMQWRMLARRCPSGSMTLVGDFGQASRAGALSTWDDVLANLEMRVPPRRVTLSVNYRTPAEVMELANRLLPVAAPGVEAARPVRSTGSVPSVRKVDADSLVAAAAAAARAARADSGTVAVIAPYAEHAALVDSLRDLGAVADSDEAIDAPVAILSPLDAKGLEFDHVVVVEPARLVAPDAAGLRLLYVVLTRATRDLVVVHAEALPEALDRS